MNWQAIDNTVAVAIPLFVLQLLPERLHAWYRSIRMFGLPPVASIRRTLDLDVMRTFNTVAGLPRMHPAKQSLMFFSSGLASLALWTVFHLTCTLSLSLTLIAFGIQRLLSRGLPPAVFLLGASSDDLDQLWIDIADRIDPLAVVSLVKPSPHVVGPSFVDPRQLTPFAKEAWTNSFGRNRAEEYRSFHSYRTLADDQWRRVVADLISICPIVIIDVRQSSPLVREELCRAVAVSPDKLLLVTGTWGENALTEGEEALGSREDAVPKLTRLHKHALMEFISRLTAVGVPNRERRRFGLPAVAALTAPEQAESERNYLKALIEQWGETFGFGATLGARSEDGSSIDVALERDGHRIACHIVATSVDEQQLTNIGTGFEEVAVVSMTGKLSKNFRGRLPVGATLYAADEFYAMLVEKFPYAISTQKSDAGRANPALNSADIPYFLPALLRRLHDEDLSIRDAAVNSLAALDDFSVFDELLGVALFDEDANVRRHALAELKRIGKRAITFLASPPSGREDRRISTNLRPLMRDLVLPGLVRVTHDPHEGVAEAARTARRELGSWPVPEQEGPPMSSADESRIVVTVFPPSHLLPSGKAKLFFYVSFCPPPNGRTDKPSHVRLTLRSLGLAAAPEAISIRKISGWAGGIVDLKLRRQGKAEQLHLNLECFVDDRHCFSKEFVVPKRTSDESIQPTWEALPTLMGWRSTDPEPRE